MEPWTHARVGSAVAPVDRHATIVAGERRALLDHSSRFAMISRDGVAAVLTRASADGA